MPTTRQDADFAEEMVDSIGEVTMKKSALDNAILWIGNNLDPDDVFDEKDLIAWATSNGYVKE